LTIKIQPFTHWHAGEGLEKEENMKRNVLSLIVLVSMLLGMVSSVGASSALASAPSQPAEQSPIQSTVVRIYFTSQDDLNQLAARFDLLEEVNQEQGYVLAILSPAEYSYLQQAGYRLEIDEGKTRLLNNPREALPGQGIDTIPGYPCYRTVEETHEDMQQIALAYPDMTELYDIGDSWDKVTPGGNPGYDILALRLTNENFGNVDEKPTFFLMAEIHAREYATAELAMRYIEYLIDNYNIDPDITWLLDYFRIYVVPMTNPDGRKIAEQGVWWRKNVDSDDGCTDPNNWGTDLNRNHTFKWNMGGSDDWPCGETYHGPTAGSEPEVQAIESFILTLFPDQRGPGDTDPAPLDSTGVFITLHSAASLVLWPWGWSSSPAPNGTQLETLGRHLAYFNGYTPQQSYQLYQTSGTSDEFVYGELGVPGYTYELAGEFFQNCSSFENTDVPDNIDSLMYAYKTARLPYMNPAGPDSLNIMASPAAVAPGEPVLLTATANDTRYAGGEPSQNIAEAHYSIDNPAWIPDTSTYPMVASDGNFNSNIENIEGTIDTTGLTSGRHIIYVESKDANGNWGVTSATFLFIIEPGISPVIDGYVLQAGTNLPVSASVSAGLFNTATDPATGYYSMTVISGTYDMIAEADNFAPAYADDVIAQDYQVVHQDFLLYPMCTIFSDDVENGNQGWVPGGSPNTWAITTENSHSPSHSWTDSPGGYYPNNANNFIISPSFDFTDYTGVTLNFWHTYATEGGWDYASVEYNTGSGWNTAIQYDGSHTWDQAEVSMPSLDGVESAQIRFHLTSDYYQTYDGWHVDDISITAGGPGCMPPIPPTAEFTSNSPVYLGEQMLFTNGTTGSVPMTYEWDFGDGIGTSTDVNPTYTYIDTGSYTVTLVATNNLGTDSISHTVTVEPGAVTDINLTQVTTGTLFPGDIVEFLLDLQPDDSATPFSYSYDFDDGTVITGTSEMEPWSFFHIFNSPGVYTVQVAVKNDAMPDPIMDSLVVYVNYELFLPLTRK